MVAELIKEIQEFGRPRNVTGVRGDLGMANYHSKLTPHPGLIYPLTQLTRKETTFKWSNIEHDAFLKSRFTEKLGLYHQQLYRK
jgi:hypothetical protein